MTHKYHYIDTPMKNMKYQCDEGGLLEDPILYRMLFGSLIYLTITRLDISYVVHIVSKLMQAPQHLFLIVIHLIIQYIFGTLSCSLFFHTGSSL
jgi:hypothetical protein